MTPIVIMVERVGGWGGRGACCMSETAAVDLCTAALRDSALTVGGGGDSSCCCSFRLRCQIISREADLVQTAVKLSSKMSCTKL